MDLSELKTLKVSNGALKSDRLPGRLKVLAWGDNDSIEGVYRAGDKTASILAENQRKTGFERVAIDFAHCSVTGSEMNKELLKQGQPPLIFGYGRVNPIPGDGIYLEDIAWTPLGVQHAKNFEDISPALKNDENREVTLIHSIALTPNGKVTGLQFFSAHQQNETMKPEDYLSISELAPAIGLNAAAKKEDVVKRLGLLSVFSAVLVCGADGKPTSLLGAEIKDGKLVLLNIDSRVKTLEEAGTKGIATLSATIDGQVKTFSAEDLVKTLTRLDALETLLKESKDSAQNVERTNIIKLFSADGKVPKNADGKAFTSEELLKMPVDTLRLLHANTPSTVPIHQRNKTSLQDTNPQRHRDAKGNVSLAGIFNEENARNGQGSPAHAVSA